MCQLVTGTTFCCPVKDMVSEKDVMTSSLITSYQRHASSASSKLTARDNYGNRKMFTIPPTPLGSSVCNINSNTMVVM